MHTNIPHTNLATNLEAVCLPLLLELHELALDTVQFKWKIMSAVAWLRASCLPAIARPRLPDTYQN